MFRVMENEIKVFVAWLKKYVKDDKQMTAKAIALEIGVDPTTISGYIRKRTKPSFKIREKITKATGVDYKDIMSQGRQAIKNKNQPVETSDRDNFVKFETDLEREPFEVIKTFRYQEKAILANKLLSELEQLDIEEYFALIGKLEGRVAMLRQNKESNQPLGEEKGSRSA